jgi:hypothetical protein
MIIILAAFSSYVLDLPKNLYKKRTRKMLMKLTIGVNFTNILHAHFLREQIAQLFSNYSLALCLFGKRILTKKARVKCSQIGISLVTFVQ